MSTSANQWQELPFSEAVLVNPTTSLERGKVYPFVEMAAISAGTRDVKCSEQREFSGGGSKFRDRDTLMARITPCLENGKIARFQAPEGQPVGHGSTEFIVIRGRPDVSDNDFAYYLTISPEVRHFAISQMTGSSGRQRVPTDAFAGISIPLPPLDEQKAIAAVLGTLDDKIELNRRMNVTLKSMAQTLFKKWFVDAAAETLPKGWRTCTLSEVIEVKHGFAYQGEFFRDEPCRDILLTPGNFAIGGGFKEDKFKYYEGPTPEEYVLAEGDLLITMTDLSKAGDTLGYGALLPAPPDGSRFHHNQRLGKVEILNSEIINKSFLYEVLRSNNYRAEILGSATGTTVKHTSPGRIKAFEFILPDSELMRRFGELAGQWHSLAIKNQIASRKLTRLRDTLLPHLVSGELSVAALTRQHD